jgi:hypothetical protein
MAGDCAPRAGAGLGDGVEVAWRLAVADLHSIATRSPSLA